MEEGIISKILDGTEKVDAGKFHCMSERGETSETISIYCDAVVRKKRGGKGDYVLVSPYISERTAQMSLSIRWKMIHIKRAAGLLGMIWWHRQYRYIWTVCR